MFLQGPYFSEEGALGLPKAKIILVRTLLAPKNFVKVKPSQSLGKWENNISKKTLPMSSWSYKVKTAVYSGVNDVSSIEA